ncbi:MAG: AtpZ/AtpI family protein [Bacteroidota bacterium]
MSTLKEEDKEEIRKSSRKWLKYSGMGFQMIIIILVFTYAGVYLDEYMGWAPYGTMVLSLIGVASGLYVALRDFL